MISVICVYNNKDILRKFLLSSLNYQATYNYELILVDNTTGKFESAPKALNFGASMAKGDYLMFVHQDVYLLDRDWIKKAENILNKINDLGIAGVAGVTIDGKKIGHVVEGPERSLYPSSIQCSDPIEVQTVDELLLIIPKSVFNILKFDIRLTGWHLYGVDYSLSVKKINLKPYVIPLKVWHYSRGRIDQSYFKLLWRVMKKHGVKKLHTTCGTWYRSKLLTALSLLKVATFSQIGKMIGRNTIGSGVYINHIKELFKS